MTDITFLSVIKCCHALVDLGASVGDTNDDITTRSSTDRRYCGDILRKAAADQMIWFHAPVTPVSFARRESASLIDVHVQLRHQSDFIENLIALCGPRCRHIQFEIEHRISTKDYSNTVDYQIRSAADFVVLILFSKTQGCRDWQKTERIRHYLAFISPKYAHLSTGADAVILRA